MAYREKVIKGLELCVASEFTNSGECDGMDECPYYDDAEFGCIMSLMRDALELLKPVKPQEHDYVIYGYRFTCGACHHKIWRNNNFCPNCGRAVKWDGEG